MVTPEGCGKAVGCLFPALTKILTEMFISRRISMAAVSSVFVILVNGSTLFGFVVRRIVLKEKMESGDDHYIQMLRYYARNINRHPATGAYVRPPLAQWLRLPEVRGAESVQSRHLARARHVLLSRALSRRFEAACVLRHCPFVFVFLVKQTFINSP